MKDEVNIRTLDIRGKICPMTFVYTKLSLEKMEKGEILEVILDFPAAVENIPSSCKRQNLGEVLEIKEIKADRKTWCLVIRKI
ncbi:MAG: sulfurtransferase TusA family protein [Promethearchaeota archaeon]